MRFDVTVAAPAVDAWRAVTDGPALDCWFMPECSVEAGLGGAVRFTFGDEAGRQFRGVVAAWDPPHAVEYAFDTGVRLRFELTPVPDATHVVLMFSFAPGMVADPIDDDPGGDVPGGPGTPWQPGFLAGLHLCVDALAPHLAGRGLTRPEAQAAVDAFNAGIRPPEWHDLVPRYRDLIRTTFKAL